MKKVVLLFSLIAVLAIQANAQKKKSYQSSDPSNYETALGIRLNPWVVGFTIKHFIKGPHAIEGLVTTNHSHKTNVTFTGLYEYNWNIGVPGLNMYAGGGAHVGFYDRRDYDWDRYIDKGKGTYVSPGLDGIIGVEYTFKKIPLNISADLKPYVQFVGPTNYLGEEIGGVSARYTF
ncbi:hypothetical protein SAMN05660461_6131 [Chitinophaga ginsengisegetis]|uniref:Outer membrane protein beta-barrel domain-containing protein n=1 Tax=Chitinophaga ginsengisegetis TaxID=393003 RepID=A0A1T5PCB0_9BACT|nr:hypothetical protein [Chitinophaga ginsengisegetis]MDR6569292.1 hypothetical protein [Chitinophaga ginsengisegetis]MDR6648677.1 hypothetical protein [Chitinophaga ginsengisegetis]MDR6655375.1 hypothetical protein [Chitinophaga ginsengisegetis]SKD10227.1 hypothetical protein SAMN05660461_6131 [Chitinophaga ginsengisegetis]